MSKEYVKKMSKKINLSLLFLFFVSIYILPLGVRSLIAPDELRYAEIPREMIASGDWVVPHFNGLRYFEKPVLGYWIHAGAMLLFGENNFAIRLPSALSVGLSALLIYILIFQVLKDRAKERDQKSILGVLIFLICFEVFVVGNAAVLDNLFSLFLTSTIVFFYFASEAPKRSRAEKYFLFLSGAACGLAFLTKGFLAFAVPVLVLVPFLVWQRRYIDLFRMALIPILTAIIVALPWSLLIHLKEPDFWRFFFWHEHIHRFFDSDAQHKAPFWYFFVTLPGVFLIWAFLIPASIIGIKEQFNIKTNIHKKEVGLLKLSICWFAFPFLFFSLSNGKLLTYILPCFPPFAILMAFGLMHVNIAGRQNTFLQWGTIGNCLLFCLLLIIFLWVQIFGFNGIHPYHQPWKTVMIVNSFFLIFLFCYWSFQHQKRVQKIFLYGFSPILLFLCLNFLVPDLAIEKKAPGILLSNYSQNIAKDTLIISDNQTAGAACWYFKRNDIYILGRAGEHHYGLTYKDSKSRKIDIKEAVDLIKKNKGKIILIGKAKKINRWKSKLPKPVFQDNSGLEGYIFYKY